MIGEEGTTHAVASTRTVTESTGDVRTEDHPDRPVDRVVVNQKKAQERA